MAKTLVKPLYYDSSHKEHDTIPSGSYVDVSVIPVSDDSANVLTAESDGLSVTVADLVSEESDNLIKVQDGKLKVDPVDVEVVVSDLVSDADDNLIKVQDGKLIVDADDIEDLVSDNVTVVSADKGNLITAGTDGGALLTTGNILSTSDVNLITTDSDGKLLVSEENIGLPIHEAMADYIKEVNVNGTTVTFIHGDGTTTAIDTQDNKVLQTVTTTSSSYPLLMTATAGQTSTTTSTSRFSTKISANPSTGAITATKFVGALEGSVSNATNDANGTAITSYVKSIDTSGVTITVTQGDGTTYKKTIDVSSIIQSGGGISVDSNGKLYVDFEKMTSEQLSELISEIVQDGGGLSVDDNGQIYVDFDSMPTDKFETMLKSLTVPIFLTANKAFYVDQSIGSDTIDEGRGESASKPFKTIQACVNYVSTYYNVNSRTVYIRVAPGTYDEGRLTLGSYSVTTGSIQITDYTSNVDTYGTTITASGVTTTVRCEGGTWGLQGMVLEQIASSPENGVANFVGVVTVVTGGQLTLYGCDIQQSYTGDAPSSGSVYLRAVGCYNSGSTITFGVTTRARAKLTVYKNNATSATVLFCERGGAIYASGSNTSQDYVTQTCAGDVNYFLYMTTNSFFSRIGGSTYNYAFSDNGVTAAYSYYLTNSCGCSCGGSETYFPGGGTGYVQEKTYCWYN